MHSYRQALQAVGFRTVFYIVCISVLSSAFSAHSPLTSGSLPFLFIICNSICNCSVPSQLRVKMHSKSPSVMAFCLVCLGILAKNMPKHLAGYYLLNSYFASINSSSSVPKIVVTFFAPSVPLVITMGIIPGPGFHLLYCFFRFCHVITLFLFCDF